LYRDERVDRTRLDKNESLRAGDLACEEAIMQEKERFGRVRTSFMKHLRLKYGKNIADRALSRINKRVSQGSLRINVHLMKNLDPEL
jgi:hypothetical protein